MPASISPGINWRQVGRVAVFVAIFALVIWVLTLIPRTVEVFVVATLIAYGLNPVVRAASRRIPKQAAIACVYIVFLLMTLVGFIVIVPNTIEQLQSVFSKGVAYAPAVHRWADETLESLRARFGQTILPTQVEGLEAQVFAKLSTGLSIALSGATTVIVSVANAVFVVVMGLVLSYFLLARAEDIRASFYSLFQERAQRAARFFTQEVGRVVGGFILGQVILSGFCAVATFLILLIVLPEYALLLGVITGVLYAIPYLGVIVALLIGGMLGLLTSWKVALFVMIVIFAITRIADFLVPKIMGESVGVSPMAIIFAVFAGGELFGLWGLILAIPAAALFKVVWTIWIHPWLTGKPAAIAEGELEAAS
jgi:predicted PurR-regulated permease PerM